MYRYSFFFLLLLQKCTNGLGVEVEERREE